jgi:hypothetical protein
MTHIQAEHIISTVDHLVDSTWWLKWMVSWLFIAIAMLLLRPRP